MRLSAFTPYVFIPQAYRVTGKITQHAPWHESLSPFSREDGGGTHDQNDSFGKQCLVEVFPWTPASHGVCLHYTTTLPLRCREDQPRNLPPRGCGILSSVILSIAYVIIPVPTHRYLHTRAPRVSRWLMVWQSCHGYYHWHTNLGNGACIRTSCSCRDDGIYRNFQA